MFLTRYVAIGVIGPDNDQISEGVIEVTGRDKIFAAPRVSTLQCALLLLIAAMFAQACFGQPPAKVPLDADDKRITVNSELVDLFVSVRDDQGRNVAGLKKEQFFVTDNGHPVEIKFFSDEDSPISMGLVVDLSASMRGKNIETARAALNGFIRTSHPQDEYFLIAFNERSQLLLDHSMHGEDVIRQLIRAEPSGNTSLYDAVYLALDKVQTGIYKKKAILVITDGQDNSSRYSLKEVVQLEKETGVMIYAIGLLDGMFLKGRRAGRYRLDDLTDPTGGRAFYPNANSEVDEVLERIATELRHLYSLAFVPSTADRDDDWHKLNVKLRSTAPKLKVRARAGYSRHGYHNSGTLIITAAMEAGTTTAIRTNNTCPTTTTAIQQRRLLRRRLFPAASRW